MVTTGRRDFGPQGSLYAALMAERELMGVAGAPYRLADALSRIANQYAAIVIDTRPSFSLLTKMALLAATDAIVPVEPRYLETVGLTSVIQKIKDIRDGWRHPTLRVSGLLVTRMNWRIRGHNHLLGTLDAEIGMVQVYQRVDKACRLPAADKPPRCYNSRWQAHY